jgi:CBS-domain-containing membrane protein
MNVAFFLTPKSEVAWLSIHSTMRQAFERMEAHGFTAVPLLDKDARYVGTLSEGDLLRVLIRTEGATVRSAEQLVLEQIPRRLDIRPVHINAQIEELYSRVLDQNFVPVVDDRDVFIGLIRRRAILEHYLGHRRATM